MHEYELFNASQGIECVTRVSFSHSLLNRPLGLCCAKSTQALHRRGNQRCGLMPWGVGISICPLWEVAHCQYEATGDLTTANCWKHEARVMCGWLPFHFIGRNSRFSWCFSRAQNRSGFANSALRKGIKRENEISLFWKCGSLKVKQTALGLSCVWCTCVHKFLAFHDCVELSFWKAIQTQGKRLTRHGFFEIADELQ